MQIYPLNSCTLFFNNSILGLNTKKSKIPQEKLHFKYCGQDYLIDYLQQKF